MGLHEINTEKNTFSYHCQKVSCQYHNCANWTHHQCVKHTKIVYTLVPAEEMQKRLQGAVSPEILANMGDTVMAVKHNVGTEGAARELPLDHPDIRWLNEQEVELPVCECGEKMTVKVGFSDEELAADNIAIKVRDQSNPSIVTRIDQHPAIALHQQFAEHLKARGNVYTPAPVQEVTSVPLTQDQLNQVVAHLRSLVRTNT